MTSAQIRQSFLDFFKSKGHTIVPSSSLMPDSPNLLFTNAGMNQFVPIFLAQRAPDVSKWAGAIPGSDTRAADTQKCIRAGGKHNDLEDVGLDTYHHTFFEMLGNWSFGDYFKQEAIEWAWELVTEVWKFPKHRLYATVYSPDKSKGDPSEFDQEAYDVWAAKFRAAGLDPKVHIVNGNKKDNFWMMGDTGPCGPCSELHVDLTPQGDTKGRLVNQATAECIEIWNLVFIQFNANPDGTFSPLPAKHVDTGMGFERVTGIMQNTRNFTDFTRIISNYETDIFRPIFDQIEKLSGKKYGSTLPAAGTAATEQQKMDIAFRVVADHIRTLSFAVADGIQPGNTDRNYVLRRILRRAVRYGRTLGFHEPFFYKLVAVLADTMGHVFPEIRARQDHIEQVIQREEEAFNKTLDRGLALFEEEVGRLLGTAPAPGAAERALAVGTSGSKYSKRRLPHFERPWAKYMVSFSTRQHRQLTLAERDLVLESILYAHRHHQYQLFAACVMPDHVHLLFEPQIKQPDEQGNPLFWSLGEILHGIKSTTAHRINKAAQATGVHVWEEESFDRLIRGDADLEEKFHYICRNPWDSQVVPLTENYRWLWTPDGEQAPEVSREGAGNGARGGRAPQITGAFAFRLYDEQGFPLDLTELMARERGLTVDVAGFNALMEEQKARARAAQKKQVIELSQVETTTPTQFVGYDKLEAPAKVLEVVGVKDKTAVILDSSPLYAEMGGQVGDTGEMSGGGELWRIANTQKAGDAWLHFLADKDAPAAGTEVQLAVDRPRREAIQRHHTVTHLLHWALHEVVSRDATQKGSYVGPEKLTFDFSSAPLTPQQVADVERLVNERILENAAVSWTEVGYADVKARHDIMQFFGDKYGDRVRVVQVGGKAAALDGYSMELCGGTHTRATGEIGLFRIVGESAIAAGIRRIEAVSGLEAYKRASEELQLIKAVAGKVNSPVGELEKKIEALLAQQKDLEKQLKAMQQKQAAEIARGLAAKAQTFGSTPAIVENLGAADADLLQAIADALKGQFKGVVVLGGAANNAVALVATVGPELTKKIQAGKIIQAIAPIVGGKGGGRPDNARGGGKDASKLDEALAKAKSLLG
jgi:alanyl-tRNA synthetase/REP element-mobilizing transposase RayT